MRIALADDNAAELSELAQMIESELTAAGLSPEIVTFSSGAALLENWRVGTYDAVILDIFMGEPNGVETARRIRETDSEVRLAFCTHSNEFAAESYEVSALYYLRKPLTRAGVATMLKRLRLDELERCRMVTLPGGRKVLLHSILFTEYYNHVVTVHLAKVPSLGETAGGTLRVRTSQAAMEEALLPLDSFVSPARGIIVNFYAVDRVHRGDLVLRNGQTIRVARRRYKAVQEAYEHFCLRLARQDAAT